MSKTHVVVALALASCSSLVRDEPPVPPALQAYADAARYLLPGFQSVAFYTLPLEPEPGDGGVAGPLVVRVARCGSDFEQPRGVGYGRYRGIEVWDWGPGGTSHTPDGAPAETIGGVPVWYHREERRGGEHVVEVWLARVGDRFVVNSYDRELLERALQRPARLEEVLRPFAALPALPDDAESAVFLLPRPGDQTYWGRPVPIEMMRASVSAQRLLLWHRQPLPEQFTSWALDAKAPVVTTLDDGWQVTTIDLEVDTMTRGLLLEMLFGLAIFI